jgi:Ni/Fe-hydrogenase subunit HybB-like protein
MQERRVQTDAEINSDLLNNVLKARPWYWPTVGVAAMVLFVAIAAWVVVIVKGLGVTGLNRPVMWGFFVTNFVFWIGISHAGVMLSAILRLSKAEWRRPATRAAEVLTVFSLMVAATNIFMHVGRVWRLLYWPMPYDFARGIWPNVRSALIWDPSAITTYLTGSILFVIVALIPDMAVIRDRTTGIRHQIYSLLSLGWRGTPRQWKLQIVAGFLLSALLLPVFVSVHSIVSWDFAAAIAVESWHSTIFAPYFVIGAVHSGVSGVVTVLIIMRFLYKWDAYIRPEHLDALGKLLIAISTAWFYFFVMEIIFSLYNLEGQEIALRELQIFQWPFAPLFVTFIITGYFFPVPLWLFKRVRRSAKWMLITTISVNIGMWLERFLIVVPGLARKQPLTFDWSTYHPSIFEILMVIGTFAFVTLMMLLFSKVFPLIPIFDIKEGQILSDEIQVGRRKVPALKVEE